MSKIAPIIVEDIQSPWKYGHTFHTYSKTKICRRQKIPKWKFFLRPRILRLTSDFSLGNTGGWGVSIKKWEWLEISGL